MEEANLHGEDARSFASRMRADEDPESDVVFAWEFWSSGYGAPSASANLQCTSVAALLAAQLQGLGPQAWRMPPSFVLQGFKRLFFRRVLAIAVVLCR